MPFLIDGHNVIAALVDIDLDDPHDEAKLVMRLRSWSARTSRKAIVVFDGGLPGGPSHTLSTADVKVIFAARHHTNADRIIRERVRALPDAGNWTVVSSDLEVRDAARDHGARTLTAQDFIEVMEHSATLDKEKPDAISAAEVAAWLEVFTEPEEDVGVPAARETGTTPPAPPAKGKPKQPQPRGRKPEPAADRHTPTIGEQLGIPVSPAPPSQRPGHKPTEVTDAEIDAWLEVFHDDPESHIPPPRLPEKRTPVSKSQKPAEPVIRKGGSLSETEVDDWLSIFEARAAAESPESDPRTGEPRTGERKSPSSSAQPAAPPSASRRRKVNPTLAKHQEKRAAAEGMEQDQTSLSREELELWHRLFDDEE